MRELHPKMLYFGTPVVLVSSLNADGSTNVAPMSSAWWVGNTAMLGMSVHSQTVRNLQQRPLCVLNLASAEMVDAVDRLALLTGRPDVPEYKRARGYRYQPDKFTAAGLTPALPAAGPAPAGAVPASGAPGSGAPASGVAGSGVAADGESPEGLRGSAMPAGVAQSLIRLEGRVRAIHEIDGADSGLRALEVPVLRTWVDESLLMAGHPKYIDPLRWNPLFMKFTEYFSGAELARPSSLARGWDMPQLPAPAYSAAHGGAGPAGGGEAVPVPAS